MLLLGRAPHRIAVPLAHAVAYVHEVEVRVDLNDVNRAMLAERADARNVDGVVSTEDDRECPALQNLAHRQLGIGMALSGVGENNIEASRIARGPNRAPARYCVPMS